MAIYGSLNPVILGVSHLKETSPSSRSQIQITAMASPLAWTATSGSPAWRAILSGASHHRDRSPNFRFLLPIANPSASPLVLTAISGLPRTTTTRLDE